MSRAELADAVSAWLWHTKRTHVPLDGHYIAKLERGAVRRTGSIYREGLRAVLDVASDHDLGMGLAGFNTAHRPQAGSPDCRTTP